jgi:hypothetical protein
MPQKVYLDDNGNPVTSGKVYLDDNGNSIHGLLQPGNVDLHHRPVVKNADGSVSTVRSIGVNVDGHEVLIPTVSDDGKILSNDEAIATFRKTGKHLGIFDTPENSTAYAKSLHESQATEYAQPQAAPKPPPFKSAPGFRGIEAVADAVRGIPDIARNLLSSEARAATLSGAKEGAMAAARDLAAAGKEELGGAKDMAVGVGSMVRHPIDTAVGMGGQFVDAAKAVPDILRNTVGSSATADTRKAVGKGFVRGAAEGATGVNADDAEANPLRAIGGGLAMVAGAKVAGSGAGALKRVAGGMTAAAAERAAAQVAERAAMARVAEGLGGGVQPEAVAEGLGGGPRPKPAAPVVTSSSKGTLRYAPGADTEAEEVARRAEMARVAAGLGGDVPADVVARGLGDAQPAAAPVKPRLVKTTQEPLSKMLDEVAAELRQPELPESVELPPPSAAQPDVTYPTVSRPAITPKPAPKLVPGAKLVKRTAPSFEDMLAEELAKGDAKAVPPPVELPPAPYSLGAGAPAAQPAVTYPRAPRLVAGKKRAPVPVPAAAAEAASEAGPAAAAPVAAAEVPSSPTFREPGIRTVSADGQPVVIRPKPGVAAELRRGVGAEKAARMLGVDRDAVQRAAPGPSRRPLAAEIAELDNDYRRRIYDERGAIDPKLAVKIGLPVAGAVAGSSLDDENPLVGGALGALGGVVASNPAATLKRFNELRAIGMLSGGALPKSVLGNIGAHLNAAGEMGSIAPIKEMLRLPENAKVAGRAFMAQTKPGGSMTSGAQVEGLGKLNLPGRIMGALDDASAQSLERAGVPTDRARQLQLMEQNPAGAGGAALQRSFDTRLGRFLVPFQRVPLNQWAQGVEALDGMLPRGNRPPSVHTSARGRLATTAAIGGGLVAGDDEKPNLLKLSLLAALAGSRGMPFAAGAGAALAARHGMRPAMGLLSRVGMGLPEGALTDIYNPTRAIDKPALLRFIQQINGED